MSATTKNPLSGRDTEARWAQYNPQVERGAIVISTDVTYTGTNVCKMKIGDGVTHWNSLDYFPVSSNTLQVAPAFATIGGLPMNMDLDWENYDIFPAPGILCNIVPVPSNLTIPPDGKLITIQVTDGGAPMQITMIHKKLHEGEEYTAVTITTVPGALQLIKLQYHAITAQWYFIA